MNLYNISNDDIYTTFCNNVRKICKECLIKQKELAEKIGEKPSNFSNKLWNRGVKFNLLQIARIAQELNESIDDLLSI